MAQMTQSPTTEGSEESAWDVMLSLADLTFFFNAVTERNEGRPPPSAIAPLPPPYIDQNTPYVVSQGEIRWWWRCVSNTHKATGALINACEDLIEQHMEDARFAALRLALARAQGHEE